MKKIVGLVGRASSGKDTVAEYLVEKYGFVHFSSGDLIRKYVADHKLGNPDRELLIRVGNEMRARFGGGVLVKMALKEPGEKKVISGLRALPEIDELKKAGGELWAVEAPMEKRYRWGVERGRIGDGVSLDDFRKLEELGEVSTDPNGQNLRLAIEMADKRLNNNGDLHELQKQVDEIEF